MEARAKFQFVATNADELSFTVGDTLKIVGLQDENWYKAELNGLEGFVPSNYIDFEEPRWFKKTMDRVDAEKFLHSQLLAGGSFVVRKSEQNQRYDFALSVRVGTGVQHFKILCGPPGTYYLWELTPFSSINQLVEHYRQHSLSAQENLLLRDVPEINNNATYVRANFDFTAQDKEELSIRKDDIIEVISQNDPNWWCGKLNAQTGLFPATYVTPLQNH